MRINIEIDDALMEMTLKTSNFKTKKQVIEEALKLYVKIHEQKNILNFKGKVTFFESSEEELNPSVR